MSGAAGSTWAATKDLPAEQIAEVRRKALMQSVGRLLQVAHREHYAAGSRFEEDDDGIWLANGADPVLRLPIRGPFAWGQLEARGLPVLEDLGGRAEALCGPEVFLHALRVVWPDIADLHFERLEVDFRNSYENLVLNRLITMSCLAADRGPEALTGGHTLYPFPGLRYGAAPEQVAEYSCIRGEAELPVVALGGHRFVSHTFDSELEAWSAWAGSPVGSWVPGAVPVHPWQMVSSRLLRGARSLGLVSDLPDLKPRARALASQRTCRVYPGEFDIKLPIDVTLTGEHRLLSEHHTLNAPAVSALAGAVLAEHGPASLDFQKDLAAIAHRQSPLSRHLAMIVREPVPHIGEAVVVPAVILWANLDLVRSLFRIADRERAMAVFDAYCRILLAGPVEFHARWGLSFEPHLQNSLIRIEGQMPVGLILRDLDGTILNRTRVEPLLRRHGLALESPHWAQMPEDPAAAQRLLHAMLDAHLGCVMRRLWEGWEVPIEAMEANLADRWTALRDAHGGLAGERIANLSGMHAIRCSLAVRIERCHELRFIPKETIESSRAGRVR